MEEHGIDILEAKIEMCRKALIMASGGQLKGLGIAMKKAFGIAVDNGDSVVLEAAIRKQYDLWIKAYNEPNKDIVGILAFSKANKVMSAVLDKLEEDTVDKKSKSNFITWMVFFNAAFQILFDKEVSITGENPAGSDAMGSNLH